jgi:hypothetical protein
LFIEQPDQVIHVKQVANLLSAAAEADISQRPAEMVRHHPVGEHPLVHLAHPSRPGDDAAAVDDGP